jgi:hypothetical protein
MRTLQRVGAGLFALTLFAGLAACGDTEPEEGSKAPDGAEDGGATGTGASDEFCDAIVEFNSDVGNVELDETSSEEDVTAAGEQLAPLTETLASDAPDDVADAAQEIDAAVQDLVEGDAAAFNEDSIFETYTELLGGAVEACAFEQVEVTGVDYAFEGVPATVPAGTVAFSFTNASEGEEHEMIILKKADGVTQSFEEILDLPEEESESLIEFAGAAFAPPGGDSAALAELTAGEYSMVCFIPVGGAEDGPPHFTEGMFQQFTVE